ncbi:MAG: transposase [Pseudomonadales bacterium]|nr:transposase [Pseudomonadales bacterium]
MTGFGSCARSDSKKALQQHVNDLTQERDVLLEKCKQLEEAYAVLMHQLKEMLRHRFGLKSERYVDSDNPQLSLHDDNVIGDDTTTLVPDNNVVDIQAYQSRKKAKKVLLITCREKRWLHLLPNTINHGPCHERMQRCITTSCQFNEGSGD